MGMVENVELASGNVVVALRITSPMCRALPYFEMEIERVLAGIPGMVSVKCTFDHGGNWQPLPLRGTLSDARWMLRGLAQIPASESQLLGQLLIAMRSP
jgi:metal-sulfur cluster biosynthetic enzyme